MATPKESGPAARLLTAEGQQRVEILNGHRAGISDVYHFLVRSPWRVVIPGLAGSFMLINTLFGALYALTGGIAGARPGSFVDAFFFSVQTLATIGYGVMYPQSVLAHVLVTVETLTGMLSLAMATGLVFTKFSRPKARILFSKVAVVAPRDGVPTLMFRVANERNNFVMEAQMRVTLLRTVVTREGERVRRLIDLPLVRNTSPSFVLTWTALHPITPQSPLYGVTPEQLEKDQSLIAVTFTGIDEALSQAIYGRHNYSTRELLWGVRLADILKQTPDGRAVMDYARFHDVIPAESPSTPRAGL